MISFGQAMGLIAKERVNHTNQKKRKAQRRCCRGDGQPTLWAHELRVSEEWLENEKKADADDPDDDGELSAHREHKEGGS